MEIGIDEKSRHNSAEALQKVLANQHLLYQKLRNYHWNAKGKNFIAIHRFLEECYTALSEDIDTIAERIQILGFSAKGNFSDYLKASEIKEAPEKLPKCDAMLIEVLSDIEHLIRLIRSTADICKDNKDNAGEGILVGIIEKLEKQAWLLRSSLEN